jgi:retron-type reverse transcriptase
MVKSILTVLLQLVVASREGLSHSDERTYRRMSILLVRILMGDRLGRVARSNKPMNGGPKETNGITAELGDYLREGAPTSYGNRALVVPRRCLWERRARFELNRIIRDGHGYRGYSTRPNKTTDTKLPNKLLKLAEFCSKNPNRVVPDNLFTLLLTPEMYQIAYSKLKSNPGPFMTPVINPQYGISMDWVVETIDKMKSQTFDFSPGRRVTIPKANGKQRTLTVAPPRDKIIQEVLRMILEAVFEPSFSDLSHGFRPAPLGCHSALRQVKTQFGAASFFLASNFFFVSAESRLGAYKVRGGEGDITKCFDSFDHHVLMKILEDKIKDRRFTALIWKALRAGYFSFHEVKSSIVGTPQGSVISPLLANIYLDPFDKFMEKRMTEYACGKGSKITPEYKHLDYLQSQAAKKGDTQEALRLLKLKQRIPSRMHADPDFRRMYYVRYADD